MNLIKENEKLVYKIANGYYKKCKEFDVEDLVQVGFMTLIKSGHKYNPERGAVSTFITHCVSNAIRGFLKKGLKNKTEQSNSLENIDLPCDISVNVEEYFPDGSFMEIQVCKLLQEGYNKAEISRRMKTSIWNIDKAILKIQEKMRHRQ